MNLGSSPLVTLELNEKPRVRRRVTDPPHLPVGYGTRRYGTVPEESFRRTLALEQRRTERSQRPFLLMLLNGENLFHTKARERVLQDILACLAISMRETDTVGWFNKNSVIGVIFTEVDSPHNPKISEAVLRRVVTALRVKLSSEEIDSIDITLHVFPDQWNEKGPGPPAGLDLYPDIRDQKAVRRFGLGLKRMIDLAGSLFGLLLLSPLFALAAVLIKLSSKGPVLYRQARVGQFGKLFVFLKFRTMQAANDVSIHRDYVRRYISGKAPSKESHDGRPSFYKLVNDPRVTRVGRFLRRTSLDELPQLLNVLRGEMSLVGPRPPIPYECEIYQLWHRRRLLEAKPGMTGLWQVNGRSRISFDDMVRLDLRYASSWSLWLDLKILVKTPQAVLSGEGAY
jgi:lipopolysaccharide/colanic/teichoic acid biosynthesis glycosyltransferase